MEELHDGILPDLLKEITAFTGLQFTFRYGDNYAECIRMVQQGEADILGAYLGVGMNRPSAASLAAVAAVYGPEQYRD